MNRLMKIQAVRKKLKNGGLSVGGWMQLPNASVAEIMGQSGYDWVALDLEHGAVSPHQLPDFFRALELGNTLPLVRLAQSSIKDCKQALDAGSGGVIVPMVESADQLIAVRSACRWPPSGTRGVAFSRANLFGKYFEGYSEEAQAPLLVAMIESSKALSNLEDIFAVDGLDAILIGPYDLSASMGIVAQFDNPIFQFEMDRIKTLAIKKGVPAGIHVVKPSVLELRQRLNEGYRFIAYSIDSVMLSCSAENPISSLGIGEL